MHHRDLHSIRTLGLLVAVAAAGLLVGCANADTGSSAPSSTRASVVSTESYGDQVDFEPSDDDTSELDAVVAGAQSSLPYYMHVSGTDYSYVQSQPDDPTLDEILESYVDLSRLEHATIVGAVPRTQLDSDLHSYHLDGAVAAAQDVVGATDFQIGLVKTSGLIAPGASEWTSYYTLYFPSVNRFVVLVLDAKEV